jgi:hypothetical protein
MPELVQPGRAHLLSRTVVAGAKVRRFGTATTRSKQMSIPAEQEATSRAGR